MTRGALDVLQDQLDGMSAWQRAVTARTSAAGGRQPNRQLQAEARMELDALRRAQAALEARTEAALDAPLRALSRPAASAVVAHRQDWVREKIAAGLEHEGLEVLAQVEDGAEALGIGIAEQPDLIVLEGRLASIRTHEVVGLLRTTNAHTRVAVQVDSDSEVPEMLEAGAAAVFSRRVPPAVLCQQVVGLLDDARLEPLLLT